jgi:Fe-S-cluster containining protein
MNAGITYRCERCTNCCRWPGFVNVDATDISALADFIGISEHEFIQRYTRLRPQRDGLALLDKPNGECLFLSGDACGVQSAKPRQCRDFPNRWNFPGWREVCAATPVLDSRKPSSGVSTLLR